MLSKSKLYLFVFVIVFLILTRFNIDPDLGWHLAIGRHFWETGEVIRGDQFSWAMPGYEWGNYFFLYQIIVWWLFENLGYLATVFIFGAVATLAVFLLIGRRLTLPVGLAVILSATIASASLGVRPSTFSFLMFSLLLILLWRNIFRWWWSSLFWFLFFALWASLHQGFVIGLLTFLAYFAIRALRQRSRADLGVDIVAVLFAILGSLATPFGMEVYRSIFQDMVGRQTWLSIAEYQPIVVWWPLNLLYFISGLILIYIVYKHFKSSDDAFWFFLGAFLFSLGFLAASLTIFWCAALVFLASRYLNIKLAIPSDRLARLPIIFSISCAVLAFILANALNFLTSWSLDSRLVKDGYPTDAIGILGQTKGNLFNPYQWGGYLIWQLPEQKVFIDGRMTGWKKPDGTYILEDYLAISRGNCEILGRFGIQTILLEAKSNNLCFADYREVYRDSVAKILVRDYN